MKKQYLNKLTIPQNPGVYFFLGRNKEILYIGKATSLAHRVRSYFDPNLKEKRSLVIEKMVQEAKTVAHTVTDSVLEAMLLEVNLIRTHKPTYNTRSKDDKSYNHILITNSEFPQVLIMRGKDIPSEIKSTEYIALYGPFPNGKLFKEALKVVRKLFKFYDVDITKEKRSSKVTKGKIDFNRQIQLYPDSCSRKEYMQTIKHIQLFFEGKKESIIADLEKQMTYYAKHELFEAAHVCKKRISALKHIQDVSLIKDEMREYKDHNDIRIEAYDVAHHAGKDMVGAMVVFSGEDPVPSEYKTFLIKSFEGANDPRALRELLERRVNHSEWTFPDVVVVDGSVAQKNVATTIFRKLNKTVSIVAVVKNASHKPERIIGPQKLIQQHKSAILYANAEAHRFAITFHKKRRKKSFLGS